MQPGLRAAPLPLGYLIQSFRVLVGFKANVTNVSLSLFLFLFNIILAPVHLKCVIAFPQPHQGLAQVRVSFLLFLVLSGFQGLSHTLNKQSRVVLSRLYSLIMSFYTSGLFPAFQSLSGIQEPENSIPDVSTSVFLPPFSMIVFRDSPKQHWPFLAGTSTFSGSFAC